MTPGKDRDMQNAVHELLSVPVAGSLPDELSVAQHLREIENGR